MENWRRSFWAGVSIRGDESIESNANDILHYLTSARQSQNRILLAFSWRTTINPRLFFVGSSSMMMMHDDDA